MKSVTLSDQQQRLFEYVEQSSNNIFVTGRAGTGKSTLLTHLVEHTDKKFAICAPTGVAALNVGGSTIHSLFGFHSGLLGDYDIARHMNRRIREMLGVIDMLVIDEVSMVSADLLDAMSRAMGIARGRRRLPFGGAQVVMFGDPYQLAPVVSSPEEKKYYAETYASPWFFDAKVFQESELESFELSEIFRQHDEDFKTILNAIRVGEATQEMLDVVTEAGRRFPPHENVIRLASRNDIVDGINVARLGKIESPAKVFKAIFSDADAKAFGKNIPAEPEITLKVGAQVMFIKNDDASTKRLSDGTMAKRWVNGTIGTVIELPSSGGVRVEVGDEQFDVGPTTWQKIKYEIDSEFDEATGKFKEVLTPVPVAEYRQIPLRLAWAVTIHKSQGQTYEEVVIDLSQGAFSPGQTYVALSRVRSLEGLYLTAPIRLRDVMIDPHVVRFMTGAKSIAPGAIF
ncbi:MAG: DEAD/DEAH box helicase [Actinomycetes bacterium]